MSGYDIPKQDCPYCSTECECDLVDVGVGFQQCGPFHCENCGASEMHPMEVPPFVDMKTHTTPSGRVLTERECETGWYEPNTPVSPMANTCQGVLVDHQTAKQLYRRGCLDEKPELSSLGRDEADLLDRHQEFVLADGEPDYFS